MKQRKNYVPFVAGMACMVLLIGGVSGSLAAQGQEEEAPKYITVLTSEHPAGTITDKALEKVYAGQAGVALFGKEQKAPGATRTNGQGTEVPTVLTYVDEKGNANYYVSAEQIVEMLDMAGGVTYNEELNCVDFGTKILRSVDEDRQEQAFYDYEKDYGQYEILGPDGEGLIVGVGEHQPPYTTESGGVMLTVTTGKTASKNNTELALGESGEIREIHLQKMEEALKERRETSVTPKYGVNQGAYTEVNPSEIDRSTYLGSFQYQDVFQSDTEITARLDFAPFAGHYGVVSIENQGTDDILVSMRRLSTIGDDPYLSFSEVRVPKGATLERAFRIEDVDSMELKNQLELTAESCDPDLPVQVRLTTDQYRSGVENGTK